MSLNWEMFHRVLRDREKKNLFKLNCFDASLSEALMQFWSMKAHVQKQGGWAQSLTVWYSSILLLCLGKLIRKALFVFLRSN